VPDRLKVEGIAVDPKRDRCDFGKFGWITNPTGHRIELWWPIANDYLSRQRAPRLTLATAQRNMETFMNTQRRQILGMLTAVAGSALLPEPFAAAEQTPAANHLSKEKVTGIGGFFFRAHDPKALAQWYQDNLGIFITPQTSTDPVWNQQAGPTSFSPSPDKTNYFGDPAKQWMINFRVADLDKIGRTAWSSRHSRQGRPHNLSVRPLCAPSRSGRQHNRTVAAACSGHHEVASSFISSGLTSCVSTLP
jgi:glyoxylase I family protein